MAKTVYPHSILYARGINCFLCQKRSFGSAKDWRYSIGIKRSFSCINICQVPWEVLKTEARGRGFQHLPRDLVNVNALKNHARSLLLHKNWKHSHYFLHYFVWLFHDVLRTQFSRTMLILGPGSTHLVMAANLWPWYDHIESCVAVH